MKSEAATFNEFVKTKIIATLGPATQSSEMLDAIIRAGVDVLRLNMSHMPLDTADDVIARVRRISSRVAILMDLAGPKMRLTDVAEPFELEVGDTLQFDDEEGLSSREAIHVPIAGLIKALKAGNRIFVDDGRIRLEVREVLSPHAVIAEVVVGGIVRGRKGVCAPDSRFVPEDYLSEDDKKVLRFASKRHVDFVAASYVSTAQDVIDVREILGDTVSVAIIAKIESQIGVENSQEILDVADGMMVARGDLGVELPPEEVPLIQKQLIKTCNAATKPVVVATQMLESMIQNPTASRAEVSDVANAILDGTDAVMLSAETSIGSFPVEAVRTLVRVSQHVELEASLFREDLFSRPSKSKTEFVCKAAARAARELKPKAIVTFTSTGSTARNVAAYRPCVPVLATSPDDRIARRLMLQSGVHCIQAEHIGRYDVMLYSNLTLLVERGLLKLDDEIVVIGGVPVGIPGTTNMLHTGTVRHLMAMD